MMMYVVLDYRTVCTRRLRATKKQSAMMADVNLIPFSIFYTESTTTVSRPLALKCEVSKIHHISGLLQSDTFFSASRHFAQRRSTVHSHPVCFTTVHLESQ
jgi:hypothetical protein